MQEEGALSLKSNSVSDLCSVRCSHSPARSSQDQMEARWCFGACSVSSCSSAHHALGGLLEAGVMQAPPTVLLTASKLANFCHFSANLVTCVPQRPGRSSSANRRAMQIFVLKTSVPNRDAWG